MSKLGHPFQLDLAKLRSGGLWHPSGAGRSSIIGPAFTEDGTFTYPAATNTMTGQHRRGLATVVAGAANNVAGIRLNSAADHPFLRGAQGGAHTTAAGEKHPIGGFYCAMTFVIAVWPDDTSRFFAGITSLAGANAAATDSTALPSNDYFGIMHDTVDGANVINFVGRLGGGARTKTPISGGEFSPPVLAAGRQFFLEIFAWANQSTMSLSLWDVQEGLNLYNTTGGVAETVFTGPQCVISNGSTAGNAPALGINNLYYFVGD